MSLSETWYALENTAVGSYESKRRIEPESFSDLWLVLKGPQRFRTLRIAVADIEELRVLPHGLGINVELVGDRQEEMFLEISLINLNYSDIFDTFIGDLIDAATSVDRSSDVASAVAARIEHWQTFLRRSSEGLSAESLRGLYGELKVFEWLAERRGIEVAIASWVGPDGFAQDFHLGASAIEVKTSSALNPQAILIANERQLDSRDLDSLTLWLWSIDERVDHGEMLPDLISRIRSKTARSVLQEQFEIRLLKVGYLDIDSHRYDYGYKLRKSSIFDVREGFPRLTERDCPPGLGKVRYSIQVGAITEYEIVEADLIERINVGQA